MGRACASRCASAMSSRCGGEMSSKAKSGGCARASSQARLIRTQAVESSRFEHRRDRASDDRVFFENQNARPRHKPRLTDSESKSDFFMMTTP
jgi:hypothetical protein